MATRYQDELEEMVDKLGMTKVLTMLSDIANEKGDHLRSNWQDAISARKWEYAAKRIAGLSVNERMQAL